MRGNCHVGILCYRELGIGIVPYSPLGRGFFGGKASVESLPANSLLVCFSLQCFICYSDVVTFESNFELIN